MEVQMSTQAQTAISYSREAADTAFLVAQRFEGLVCALASQAALGRGDREVAAGHVLDVLEQIGTSQLLALREADHAGRADGSYPISIPGKAA